MDIRRKRMKYSDVRTPNEFEHGFRTTRLGACHRFNSDERLSDFFRLFLTMVSEERGPREAK